MLAAVPRGGSADSSATMITEPAAERELTLDEKVHAAMEKLGLQPPPPPAETETTTSTVDDDENCPDGVCAMPGTDQPPVDNKNVAAVQKQQQQQQPEEDPVSIVDRISQTMKVDSSMAWAALGATSTKSSTGNSVHYNEQAARDMIALELEMIAQIREDSEEVRQLVDEGWGVFMARRALAFAERNVADARAILMADKADEEEEEQAADMAALKERQQQEQQSAAPFKTVNVDANFDPTKMATPSGNTAAAAAATASSGTPKLAPKESVVFEATAAQVQELVLESPVPVLLDIYADWCGPCKALSPILEDIAVKSGGQLRLVKVNSDNERAIASTLQVTALPTIFGVRDGRIVHMFQGMPKSEAMMKNFLMGLLVPGQAFDPPVTADQQQSYAELSMKLLKVAGSAALPFAARERLQDRVAQLMEQLVEQRAGDVYDAEQSVKTVRALLSNTIRDPMEAKFRSVNLANKVISAKVARYPAAVAMLKIVGYRPDASNDGNTLTLGKGKTVINVAPLSVTRDAIDKWIEKTRYEVAKATRKRKDEEDRVHVAEELAAAKAAEEKAQAEQAQAFKAAVDLNECKLKVRLDGKKKSHDLVMHADDSLRSILDTNIPGLSPSDDNDEFQITCVAKRLIVQSSDTEAMNKSLREHGLMPGAALVVKLKTSESSSTTSTTKSSLSQRAAAKKLKKGSHTMQSTGIYGKDDNAKGELIDGGGGTLFEHDVSDSEEEEEAEEDWPKETNEQATPSVETAEPSATFEAEGEGSTEEDE